MTNKTGAAKSEESLDFCILKLENPQFLFIINN